MASEGGTPGTKYAGGHRIRVPPVPIPNTEVKPDTADGTAWETVWESRSLPAVIQQSPTWKSRRAFFLYVLSAERVLPIADLTHDHVDQVRRRLAIQRLDPIVGEIVGQRLVH